MTERLSWKGDERLYQPKIRSPRIRELYKVKKETGTPMTKLVDTALDQYFKIRLTPEAKVDTISDMHTAIKTREIPVKLSVEQCFDRLNDCEVFMLTRVDGMETKTGDNQLKSGWRVEFVHYDQHVVEDEDLGVVLNQAVRLMEQPPF
jgi:hypothetical protein